MAVRNFAAGGVVRTAVGLADTAAGAALTYVALVKFGASEASQWVMARNGAGHAEGGKWTSLGREPEIHLYPAGQDAGFTPPNNEWVLVVAVKPAGATKAIYYYFRFAGATWASAESTNPFTTLHEAVPAEFQFGRWNGVGSEQFTGKYAAAAVFGTALNEAEVKALVAVTDIKTGWRSKGPLGLWCFDQASVAEPVLDLTGNGADQISIEGTTVADEQPPMPYEVAPVVMIPPKSQPDTRLSISALAADGRTVAARWGPDEAAVGNIPRGLQFGTADPGLFKDAGFSLARPINRDWLDLVQLRGVRIHGAGRRVAWEGRLHEIPSHHAEDYAISPTAVGLAAALEDDPSFREIYIGRDLQEWDEIAAARRLGYGTTFSYQGFSVAPDSGEGRPSLALEVDGHWEAQRPTQGAMMDAGAGLAIAAVDYAFILSTNDANFELELNNSLTDAGPAAETSGDLATGALEGANTWTPATPRRVIAAFWRYALANAGADGAQYRAYLRFLAWIGNHGVPIRGERPNRGVYGSDAIANIVERCAPGLNFTTGDGGSIEPSTYVIPHLAFRDGLKGADAIMAVNAYHQRTWGVEEGKRFFWRSTEKPRKRWRIRRSLGHGIDLLGPQSEAAINGLVVKFTDPAGVTRVVGPPGCTTADVTSALLADESPTNPVNLAGLGRKWGELQLSFVTDYNGAIQVGNAQLIDTLRFAASRGSITVTGCVEDDATGILYPAWCMRAGDSAVVVDGDGIERRIIETGYEHDAQKITCNLDSTPHKVDALMERMGLALVGYVD